jgi:ATP synthase protein I
MTARKDSTVVKILSYQFLILLVITAGFAVMGNEQQALSAALGGIAAFIPNLGFSLWIQKSAGQDVRKVVNSFYVGESVKLLLTIVLFVMIFQIPNIQILALLISYVAALSVFWFALLMR